MGWNLVVVATVALDYEIMKYLHFSYSDSKSEPTFDSKDFTSATNEYFEQH
jgi:hypothetical protein